MIYKREEYIQEDPQNEKFPAKQIETLTPVTGGPEKYYGRLSMAVQTPMGMTSLPINFEIEAADIAEAFSKFEALADTEIEKAKNELQGQLQEMRRKSQSRIVTPGEIASGGMGGLQI